VRAARVIEGSAPVGRRRHEHDRPRMERALDESCAPGAQRSSTRRCRGDVGARRHARHHGGRRQAGVRERPAVWRFWAGRSPSAAPPAAAAREAVQPILVSGDASGSERGAGLRAQCGLDPSVMIEAVSGGAAQSWQLTNLGPRIIKRTSPRASWSTWCRRPEAGPGGLREPVFHCPRRVCEPAVRLRPGARLRARRDAKPGEVVERCRAKND